MKNNDGFVLHHQKREYPIYALNPKETLEWIDVINKTMEKNKGGKNPTQNSNSETKKVETPKIEEKVTPTNNINYNEKIIEIKNIISSNFLKESPNQSDFWNIWKQNIPLKEGNKDPIGFEISIDAQQNRICWKASKNFFFFFLKLNNK